MTFIGVLVIISGIPYIITGIVALVLAASGTGTSNQNTAALIFGIVIIVFGLIEIAVARGLFRGNNVSRIIVAIVNVLTIIGEAEAVVETIRTRLDGLWAAFTAGNQRGTSFTRSSSPSSSWPCSTRPGRTPSSGRTAPRPGS